MKQLPQPFNPMQYDPTQSGSQLPVGRHKVEIFDGEVDANKSGNGGLLRLNLKITEGQFAGVTGSDNLNLYHTGSAQAVEIAHKRLAAYCHVTQQFQLGPNGTDFTVLFNKPFWIEVVPQKEKPEYTEIKKLFDLNGNEPGKAPAQGQQQQQAGTGFNQQQNVQQNTGFNQQQQQGNQQQANAGWGNNAGGAQQPQNTQQNVQQQTGWGNQQPAQGQQQQQAGAMPWQKPQ